jgi:limonene-1,2-epoxide hydrolase
VAALRSSGYGIPAVREVVASLGLRDGRDRRTGAAEARQILDRRLDETARRSVALLRAGADLAAVLDQRGAGPAVPDQSSLSCWP